MGIDATIIAVILVSAVVGILRGFLKEVISLITWIGGIWLAVIYQIHLKKYLPWENELLKSILAFVIIIIGVLISGAVLSKILDLIVHKVGLKWIDRLLGMFFGSIRGLLLITICLMLLDNLGLTKYLESSKIKNYLQPCVSFLRKQIKGKNWKKLELIDNIEFKTINSLEEKGKKLVEKLEVNKEKLLKQGS